MYQEAGAAVRRITKKVSYQTLSLLLSIIPDTSGR